jgi:hypothetical protein
VSGPPEPPVPWEELRWAGAEVGIGRARDDLARVVAGFPPLARPLLYAWCAVRIGPRSTLRLRRRVREVGR